MADEQEPIALQVDKGLAAKLRWSAGEDLDPVFADQMHLARMNDQYYLTFGQARILTALGAPESVEVRPVGRFIIPKRTLEQLVALLKRGLEEWEE